MWIHIPICCCNSQYYFAQYIFSEWQFKLAKVKAFNRLCVTVVSVLLEFTVEHFLHSYPVFYVIALSHCDLEG